MFEISAHLGLNNNLPHLTPHPRNRQQIIILSLRDFKDQIFLKFHFTLISLQMLQLKKKIHSPER